MDRETDAQIIAVDTSQAWVTRTQASMRRAGHELHWIDVGPVGKWGMPKDFSHRDAFRAYVNVLWSGDRTPDCVLIDGRFRISCFLTTLQHAKPGTRVIFDDYVGRAPFQVVEEVLAPEHCCNRQALFIVPEARDPERLNKMAEQFLMVRD
jgi:hypothetical protein